MILFVKIQFYLLIYHFMSLKVHTQGYYSYTDNNAG